MKQLWASGYHNGFAHHRSQVEDLLGTVHFLPSFRPSTIIYMYLHHKVGRSLICFEGRGRISRSGFTQEFKMGSCVFQCVIPHQWIAQQQVGPVSVYKVFIPYDIHSATTAHDFNSPCSCLFVFYVPSPARSFRNGTPYTVPCKGREAQFLHRFYWESNPRAHAVAWQCITLSLHHASSTP